MSDQQRIVDILLPWVRFCAGFVVRASRNRPARADPATAQCDPRRPSAPTRRRRSLRSMSADGSSTPRDHFGRRQQRTASSGPSLIAAAQRDKHSEAAYGTARVLARQLAEFKCAQLLTQTLGEEESSNQMLTCLPDPLLQELTLGKRPANPS